MSTAASAQVTSLATMNALKKSQVAASSRATSSTRNPAPFTPLVPLVRFMTPPLFPWAPGESRSQLYCTTSLIQVKFPTDASGGASLPVLPLPQAAGQEGDRRDHHHRGDAADDDRGHGAEPLRRDARLDGAPLVRARDEERVDGGPASAQLVGRPHL